MEKISSIFTFTVFCILLINISSGTELVEDAELVPSPNWPEDLATSSQIVFRPLFVYKQKKATLDEKNRRRAEIDVSALEKEAQPVNIPYRPHYYYDPYLSYYYNQHYYRPYYNNYYPHNQYAYNWPNGGS